MWTYVVCRKVKCQLFIVATGLGQQEWLTSSCFNFTVDAWVCVHLCIFQYLWNKFAKSVLLTALYEILPNNKIEMQTASTKTRQREHNKWVIWAQPLHESTFINVVSSEERSNNRAVWLLLLAVTLKATTESLTCRLWVRASIHWHYWQKYPICMYFVWAKKWKVRGQTERQKGWGGGRGRTKCSRLYFCQPLLCARRAAKLMWF